MAYFKVNVEIPILLSILAFMLTATISTNLVIFRTCYVVMGYNKTTCALLGNNQTNETENLEKLVEPKAATINMVRQTVESCLTLLMCLFIGPWSDRFGRKPVLVVSLLGTCISFVLMAFFSFWDNLSPWYLLITSIPVMITGGSSAFTTVALAYITDSTSEQYRGLRMGVLEALFALGFLIGNTSSSYLFYATNYVSVYAIAAAICAIAMFYTVFFVAESLPMTETQEQFKGFFEISSMRHMMEITFLRREHFNRALLFICIAILTIFNLAISGDMILNFMFMREKFDWSLQKYTLFNSAASIVWILGTVIGVYILHQLLKIPESVLVLIGFLSMFNGIIVTGLATKDWHIYLATAIKLLGGVMSPMVRSLISKIVEPDEIGKIFSVLTVCVALFGMTASPLYTFIYNSTINSNPGIFCFVSAGFHGINVILTCVVIALQRVNSQRYSRLENNNEPSSTDSASTSTDETAVVS